MEVQISSWPTYSALRGLFVWKILPWPDLCPATHMYWSILCNCHLQTGLNYLLKSLSSCDSGAPFTMYFTVNSASQHFMSEFGLSDSHSHDGRLLSQEYIFDIFLNHLKDINTPKHINAHTTIGLSRHSLGTVSIHIFQTPYFPQFTSFSYCLAYQYGNSNLS